MDTRIKDILNLETMSGLKCLTKPGGLDNIVTKVGILDYELTSRGRAFSTDHHWLQGEFVLTSFQYARDHPELITAAIKKMCQYKTSGMAIKNVFQTPIPEEAIRYANAHAYPLFLFTNQQLFFEDVIVHVNKLIEGRRQQSYRESITAEILFQSCDSRDIEEKAKVVAPFLSNKFQCAYLLGKESDSIPVMAEQTLRSTECEAVRYKGGLFLLFNQPVNIRPVEYYLEQLGIRTDRFYIGVSEVFYFRSRLRKALMQAIFAMRCSQMTGQAVSDYRNIGVYQFLFPHQGDPWIEDYYNAYIPVISEFDMDNNSNLLETALLYEKYNGNIKEIAADQNAHFNTIRYRMKKVAELFHEEMGNPEFESRLIVALKIYRMRQLCDHVGDLV